MAALQEEREPADPEAADPILHVAGADWRTSSWPMPTASHRHAPPMLLPEEATSPTGMRQPRRHYYARSVAQSAPPLPPRHAPLESAIATLADQNNRYSSVQAELVLLGAGAAAEAKQRNRELVERNQQLLVRQQKLESESAAARELKNRAVVLSQENARLTTHASEAAALCKRAKVLLD